MREHRRTDDQLVHESGARRRRGRTKPQRMPSASPTNAPVCGSGCSGDAVATISRSMSSGASPARLIASAAAAVASVAVVSPRPATRRSRMPVRSTIHASFVSTRASRSAFVTRPSGTAKPQPTTATGRPLTRLAARPRADPAAGALLLAPTCPSSCPRTGCGPTRWFRALPQLRSRHLRTRGRSDRPSSSGTRRPHGAMITRSGTSSVSPCNGTGAGREAGTDAGIRSGLRGSGGSSSDSAAGGGVTAFTERVTGQCPRCEQCRLSATDR